MGCYSQAIICGQRLRVYTRGANFGFFGSIFRGFQTGVLVRDLYFVKLYKVIGEQSITLFCINARYGLQRGGRLATSVRREFVRFVIFINRRTRRYNLFNGRFNILFYITIRCTRGRRVPLTCFSSKLAIRNGFDIFSALWGDLRGCVPFQKLWGFWVLRPHYIFLFSFNGGLGHSMHRVCVGL